MKKICLFIIIAVIITSLGCGKKSVSIKEGWNNDHTIYTNLYGVHITQEEYDNMRKVIIIKKMVKDLNVPIEIIQCPIVREESGLALSSRNKYLSEEGKKDALVLSQILKNIKACFQKGITDVSALKETAYSYLTDKHDMEYLEILDRNTLEEKPNADRESIALIACRVEGVRLIDNIYLGE